MQLAFHTLYQSQTRECQFSQLISIYFFDVSPEYLEINQDDNLYFKIRCRFFGKMIIYVRRICKMSVNTCLVE